MSVRLLRGSCVSFLGIGVRIIRVCCLGVYTYTYVRTRKSAKKQLLSGHRRREFFFFCEPSTPVVHHSNEVAKRKNETACVTNIK